MIVVGWKSKTLRQAHLETYQCPNCEAKNSVIAIIADYFLLFWIPTFPYKKTAHIICLACNLAQPDTKLSSALKAKIKEVKASVKFPNYMFSGLLVVAAAIAFIYYIDTLNTEMEEGFIANPMIGDVYVLQDLEKRTSYNIYLLKVVDIVDDSLHVAFNSYSYHGVVRKLDSDDGFYDVWYAMHINELTYFAQTGKLKKVFRYYQPDTGFDRTLEYNLNDAPSDQLNTTQSTDQ